jgi:hypothetical protein
VLTSRWLTGRPPSTLRHHINGLTKDGVIKKFVMVATSGPKTALSENAEAQLLDYIARCRRLASTLDKDHVLQKAAELEKIEAEAQGRRPKWPEGMATDKWWRGFKSRTGVVMRCCQDTDLDRLQSQTPEIITEFFEKYKEAKEGIHDSRIFNWDETGLMRVGRWSKGVVEKKGAGAVKRSSGIATGTSLP